VDFVEILLEHSHIIGQVIELVINCVSKFFHHVEEIVHFDMDALQSFSYNKFDIGIINWNFDFHGFTKFLLEELVMHTDERAITRIGNHAVTEIWRLRFDGAIVASSTETCKSSLVESILLEPGVDAAVWRINSEICIRLPSL
jgi:hypothetical protein